MPRSTAGRPGRRPSGRRLGDQDRRRDRREVGAEMHRALEDEHASACGLDADDGGTAPGRAAAPCGSPPTTRTPSISRQAHGPELASCGAIAITGPCSATWPSPSARTLKSAAERRLAGDAATFGTAAPSAQRRARPGPAARPVRRLARRPAARARRRCGAPPAPRRAARAACRWCRCCRRRRGCPGCRRSPPARRRRPAIAQRARAPRPRREHRQLEVAPLRAASRSSALDGALHAASLRRRSRAPTGPHSAISAAGKPGAKRQHGTSASRAAPARRRSLPPARAIVLCAFSGIRNGRRRTCIGSRRAALQRCARAAGGARAGRRPCRRADRCGRRPAHRPRRPCAASRWRAGRGWRRSARAARRRARTPRQQLALAVVERARPPSRRAGRGRRASSRPCAPRDASTITPAMRSKASLVTCADGVAAAQRDGTSCVPACACRAR